MEPAFLHAILDDVPETDRELVVVNRTEAEPVQKLLERAFEDVVPVSEASAAGKTENVVCLVESDEVVATSPLEEIMDSLLLVNSDLYRTGSERFEEHRIPDVIRSLADQVLTLRGYPMSNKEKLILILVSRLVERTAWANGVGTLRSTFQELSRIRDELGTWEVYQRLEGTGVETHVYGVPDWTPSLEGVHVHGGDDAAYRRSWCVVYTHPEESGADVALLAVEVDSNVWRGMWTFDDARVQRIDEAIASNF
jgi:hypothetical protein